MYTIKNPWMKFYVKDYLTDVNVKALTYEEKGLYTDMLFLMWDNGGFLPGEMTKLAKIFGFSEKKFEKKFKKISKFFQKVVTDGEVFLTQKRLKKEWDELEEITEKRRQAGEKGGIATREKQAANATANDKQMPDVCRDFAALDTDTDSDSDSDSEKDLKIYSPKGELSTPKGVAPCPHEKIISLFSELLPELPQVSIATETRKKTLKSRWREDKKRQNLDWWRDYFLYVKASDYLMGRVTQKDGRVWQTDFDWIIKLSNMVNILEGKYSNDRFIARKPREQNIGDHFRAMADEILAEANAESTVQGQVIDINDFNASGDLEHG